MKAVTPGSRPARASRALAGSDAAMKRLMVLGVAVAVGMLAVGIALLLDARRDAWAQAERASANLVKTLERDIARNLAVFDLSLLGAIEALDQPGLADASPGLRQAAIFDRAVSAEYLGSVLILDAAGDVTHDSTSAVPHRLNLADRDYFRVHRDDPGLGLYLSKPFRSRLRGNDASIAISRRISAPDGSFAGVAVGTLRLAYFSDMFSSLDLGHDGAVVLLRDDGRMVARYPLFDRTLNQDFRSTAVGSVMLRDGTGRVTATSSVDGVERLLEFRRIGRLPLRIAVGVAVRDILAPWWRKAAMVGGILAALAVAAVVLLQLFRREIARRRIAEASLREAARRLELAAKTDALTGLPNRRAFAEAMDAAWLSACRSGQPLSLLMVDTDNFKLFNDRYGHQEGDRALQAVGGAIDANLRRAPHLGAGVDLGARYGGEEFAILLPDTDGNQALCVAERIRAAVRAAAIPHADAPDGFVTVSIGVATAIPHDATGIAAGNAAGRNRILIRSADAALYDAKHAGRNRVCVSTATPGLILTPACPTWERRDSRIA